MSQACMTSAPAPTPSSKLLWFKDFKLKATTCLLHLYQVCVEPYEAAPPPVSEAASWFSPSSGDIQILLRVKMGDHTVCENLINRLAVSIHK